MNRDKEALVRRERASALIQKAKAQVMMRTPDTAALIMKLRIAEDSHARTMYTDGRVLGYGDRVVARARHGGEELHGVRP